MTAHAGMRMGAATRRLLQYGCTSLIVVVVLLVGLTVCRHWMRSDEAVSNRPVSAHAPVGYAMDGVRFSADRAGRRSLEIRADRVVLKKKKVALLRFGLMKEAVFSNAQVDLFSDPPKPNRSPADQVQDGQAPSFREAFSEQSLASLSMKNVTTVRFSPIILRLHVGDSEEITISAAYATINPQTREIQFRGNVRWQNDALVLRTDSLAASLTENTLRVSGGYRLVDGRKITSGTSLRSDLFLTSLSDIPRSALAGQDRPRNLNTPTHHDEGLGSSMYSAGAASPYIRTGALKH